MKLKTLPLQQKKQRKKIDQIDRQMAKLIGKRIRLSQKVMAQKQKNGQKRIDKTREQEIISNYCKSLGPLSTRSRAQNFVRALLRMNPKY